MTDYSTISTAALLKIRGRSRLGSEEDRAIETELAARGETKANREYTRKTPLLFTGAEWAATREREGP